MARKTVSPFSAFAARRIGRGRRGQRAQVREDLPRFVIEDARVGRHLGARDAVFDRLEQTIVGPARRPHLRDVGPADAARVHAVAIRAAPAKQTHAGADGVRVAFEGILRRQILGGEETAAEHAQHRDCQHRSRPRHTRLLALARRRFVSRPLYLKNGRHRSSSRPWLQPRSSTPGRSTENGRRCYDRSLWVKFGRPSCWKMETIGRSRALVRSNRGRLLCAMRRVDADVLVDTGAVLVLLPQDMVEALGLGAMDKAVVILANDQKVEMAIAGPRLEAWDSAHPADDAGDAVDGHLRAVGDAPGRVGDAEHHRDAALARERREVRRAAAAFGDDARHARQDVTERRSRRRASPARRPARRAPARTRS